MHRLIWLKIIPLALLGLTLVGVGCTNPCNNADCGDFGNCSEVSDEAVCICQTGYDRDAEGRCNVRNTSKYQGQWQVEDTCTANRAGQVETLTCEYTVTIDTIGGGDVRRMTVTNFPDLTCFDTSPIDCELLVEATAFREALVLRGVASGITYCDDQGVGVGFSGFQLSDGASGPAEAALSDDGNQMTLSYRLSYQLDADQDGVLENYVFDCESTLTRL